MSKYTNSKKNILVNKYVWLVFLAILAIAITFLEVSNTTNFIGKKPDDMLNKNSTQASPTNTVDYGPPKDEDKVISPEKNNAPKTSESTTNTSADISVVITRANRGSVGVFIEKIDGGTCKLSVMQSGVEKISMTADIFQERDYSTCKGFNFDSSSLDNSPIIIKVTVSSGSRTGMATQEVKE